jgi:hypothetical protein
MPMVRSAERNSPTSRRKSATDRTTVKAFMPSVPSTANDSSTRRAGADDE